MLWSGRRLAPIVGPLLLRRRPDLCSGKLDETTRILFRAAVHARQQFDVDLTLDADDGTVAEANARGAIFVTGRFPLNALFTRWLYDRRGRVATLRTRNRPAAVWGTDAAVEVVLPTPAVMVRIRALVSDGCAVVMALDLPREGTETIAVETRFGISRIATPVFSLAKRLDLPLFFFGVRATAGGLPVATLQRIPPDAQEFAERFRRHAGLMLP